MENCSCTLTLNLAELFDDIQDNEMYTVIRLGNDLINNYYEIRIPLEENGLGRHS